MRRLAGRVASVIRDRGQESLALHDMVRAQPESMKRVLERLKHDNESVLGALLAAKDTIEKEGGTPVDAFHPYYGWIVKDGKITPAGEKFQADWKKETDALTIPDLA